MTTSDTPSSITTTTSTTVVPQKNGQSCIIDSGCESGYCDATQKICASTNLNDGSSCIDPSQCISNYCSSTGICGRSAVNGPCTLNNDCTSAICDTANHICGGINLADGEKCFQASQSQSQFCNSMGECGRNAVDGLCSRDSDCESNLCDVSQRKCLAINPDCRIAMLTN